MAKIPLFGMAYLYIFTIMSNVRNHNGCLCPVDIVTYVGVHIQLSLSPAGTSIIYYCYVRIHATYIHKYIRTCVHARARQFRQHIQSFADSWVKVTFTGQSTLGKSTAGTALASGACCVKFRNLVTSNRETLIKFFINVIK